MPVTGHCHLCGKNLTRVIPCRIYIFYWLSFRTCIYHVSLKSHLQNCSYNHNSGFLTDALTVLSTRLLLLWRIMQTRQEFSRPPYPFCEIFLSATSKVKKWWQLLGNFTNWMLHKFFCSVGISAYNVAIFGSILHFNTINYIMQTRRCFTDTPFNFLMPISYRL